MATSAAAWPTFDGVGEGARPGGEGGHEQVEAAGDVGVALFGGSFPVGGAFGVVLDGVEPFSLVGGVHLIEGVHEVRVAPTSLPEILRAVWSGLSVDHRLMFSAATPVGCLFFLVLGACLR